jgi:hypothetical protein
MSAPTGTDAGRKPFALILLVGIAALYLALETGAYILYTYPSLLPASRSDPLRIAFRMLYRTQLPLIQWEPACATYSERIANYTLRPGHCTHTTAEFSVEVAANSMGLRDTEDALHAPEVIFLGASFTMGWGVDNADTAAKLTETTTGLRVLNAGLPGYGVRQSLALLRHLDRSRLRYLVITYFVPQDIIISRHALDPGVDATSYRLPREHYERTVAQYLARRKTPMFGRYFYRLAIGYFTEYAERREIDSRSDEAVVAKDFNADTGREFVEVLNRAADLLGESRIILVPSAPGCRIGADRISAEVDAALAAGHKRIGNPIITTRLDAERSRADCFVLDNHLNARAHAAIARNVSEIIRRDGTSVSRSTP